MINYFEGQRILLFAVNSFIFLSRGKYMEFFMKENFDDIFFRVLKLQANAINFYIA